MGTRLSKNKKIIKILKLKKAIFTAVKICSILHRHVFVMQIAPKKSKQKIREEEDLQLALALSQSEEESKAKLVSQSSLSRSREQMKLKQKAIVGSWAVAMGLR